MDNANAARWIITGSFLITSIVGIALTWPLWQGKVPPNSITGFRTAKTLADPQLWYQVNTAAGRSLVMLNAVLLIATAILHFTLTKERPGLAALILTGTLVIGAILVVVQGYLMTR